MSDLDLCLEVESRSCQPLGCIQRSLSRKPLEIVAWFQRTTNSVRSAILATAWLLIFFHFWCAIMPLTGVINYVCHFLWLTDDPPQSRSAPGRSAPRPPQTRSIRPNFWDDPPQVLDRSAPIKLHQIWTEVGINDDTPWTIAVGWIQMVWMFSTRLLHPYSHL